MRVHFWGRNVERERRGLKYVVSDVAAEYCEIDGVFMVTIEVDGVRPTEHEPGDTVPPGPSCATGLRRTLTQQANCRRYRLNGLLTSYDNDRFITFSAFIAVEVGDDFKVESAQHVIADQQPRRLGVNRELLHYPTDDTRGAGRIRFQLVVH